MEYIADKLSESAGVEHVLRLAEKYLGTDHKVSGFYYPMQLTRQLRPEAGLWRA